MRVLIVVRVKSAKISFVPYPKPSVLMVFANTKKAKIVPVAIVLVLRKNAASLLRKIKTIKGA